MERACGIPNMSVWYKVYSLADFNITNYIMKYHDMNKTKAKKNSVETPKFKSEGEETIGE